MSERRVPERRTKGHPASTGSGWWASRWRGFGEVLPLLPALLLVNAAAIWGQAGWAYDHVTEPSWPDEARLALALLFAAAIECIGIFLAWMAHRALMANQASGNLRAGSYGVGGLAGWINWDHWYRPGAADNARAVVFAGLSAISPWLWAIWSRARNRDRLVELGLADERGVKLSTARKFWHPIRSLKVTRWAAWSGEIRPGLAVAGWEASRQPDRPRVSLHKDQVARWARHRGLPAGLSLAQVIEHERTQATLAGTFDALRELGARAAAPRPAVAAAASRPAISAPTAPRKSASPTLKSTSPESAGGGSESARGRQAQRERAKRAEDLVRAEYEAGRSISASQLAAQFPPMSTSWATNILRSVRPESPNGSKIAAG